MNTSIRVRFAPSPTGHLHIGSLRTALFNWLFAQHHNGTFLIRIEDTDRERSKIEYTQSILASLDWCGIYANEPIVVQSEREKAHQQMADELVSQRKAYKCYCTQEDIEKRFGTDTGDSASIKYDGFCYKRKDSPDSPYVIRFKLPENQRDISWHDAIRGDIKIDMGQLEDFIIVRSDNHPVYNFVVVVDDAWMKISHVIRGEDHISNTAKQILLYLACDYAVPIFAHMPLILGPSGDRLSKRDGATSVFEYKKEGFLPDALLNYLARLGWSHKDQEIFSREELIKFFTLNEVNKKGSIFDREKLEWVNSVHIRDMSWDALLTYIEKELMPDFKKRFNEWYNEKIEKALKLYQDRVKTVVQLIDELILLYDGPSEYNKEDVKKWVVDNKKILNETYTVLASQQSFDADVLEQTIKQLCKDLSCKVAAVLQPIRIALIGKSSGPGVYDMLALLGKDTSLMRIQRLLQAI